MLYHAGASVQGAIQIYLKLNRNLRICFWRVCRLKVLHLSEKLSTFIVKSGRAVESAYDNNSSPAPTQSEWAARVLDYFPICDSIQPINKLKDEDRSI